MPTPFARMKIVTVRRPLRWYRRSALRRGHAPRPAPKSVPATLPFDLLIW